MKSIDLVPIIFLLWAMDIFWKSIEQLVKKKGIYFVHEKIMSIFVRFFFGKKYYEKFNEKNLGGNKWKSRGIWGLLGGLLYLYISISMLYAAI